MLDLSCRFSSCLVLCSVVVSCLVTVRVLSCDCHVLCCLVMLFSCDRDCVVLRCLVVCLCYLVDVMSGVVLSCLIVSCVVLRFTLSVGLQLCHS